MKKSLIWIVAMLMLGILSVSAQRWSLTPEIGMTAVKRNSNRSADWRSGWKVGVGVEYQLNPERFSLKSGLYYMQRGYTYSFGPIIDIGEKTIGEIKGTFNRHFLQVPVLANFSYKLSDAVRLNLAVGPYVAFSMGDRTKAGYEYINYDSYQSGEQVYWYSGGSTESTNWSNHHSFDWGLSFQAGLEVHQWVINAGYDLSLGKEYKYDNVGVNYQTLSLSVGYKFKLGK